MRKLFLILVLLVMAATARAQEPVPEFDFGQSVGLEFPYNFSAEEDVVGCSETRTTNCIKEFRGYDATNGTLLGILTAPPDANTLMTLVIPLPNYRKMGNQKFTMEVVEVSGVKSLNNPEALAKFLPPPAVEVKVTPQQ